MASVIKAGNATDGVQVTSDNTGILELKTGTGAGTTAMTVGTDQNVTFAQAANLPNTFGFKNRIINGNMVIDQRNAGASVTGNDNTFSVDRWKCIATVNGKFTAQQTPSTTETGFATRVNAGFTNYLALVSSSAYTLLSSDYFNIGQRIEGFNAADLAWGTANAKPVTLSFWVYSSLTGTFGGSIYNTAANRSYPYSYTISAANTWEQKSISISGDTSGTWLTNNGIGLVVSFALGAGASFTGTANAWAGSYINQPTGSVNIVATNGATFYITGVQLEKGSTATSFDYRPYGTELQLCQRYFIQYGDNTTLKPISFGSASSTAAVDTLLSLPVEMRSVPTISASANLQASDWNNALTLTSPTLGGSTSKTLYLYGTVTGATQYRPYFIRTSASNGYIHFSAEL